MRACHTQQLAGNPGAHSAPSPCMQVVCRLHAHSTLASCSLPTKAIAALLGASTRTNDLSSDAACVCCSQDYQAESIPIVEADGCRVRVMAGSAQGVTGPVFMRNPGMLLDVQLEPGATFRQQARLLCGGVTILASLSRPLVHAQPRRPARQASGSTSQLSAAGTAACLSTMCRCSARTAQQLAPSASIGGAAALRFVHLLCTNCSCWGMALQARAER